MRDAESSGGTSANARRVLSTSPGPWRGRSPKSSKKSSSERFSFTGGSSHDARADGNGSSVGFAPGSRARALTGRTLEA